MSYTLSVYIYTSNNLHNSILSLGQDLVLFYGNVFPILLRVWNSFNFYIKKVTEVV